MADFGKLNFSVSFNRTSAFPIEANGYFETLEDAQAAAATAVGVGSAESTYYIGQTLTVVTEGNAKNYIIQPDKTLLEVGSGSGSTEIAITDGEEPQGDEVLWVDMNEDTSSSWEELGIQPKLESGVNIKTINSESILGEGDITIEAGTSINVVQTTGTSENDVMSQKIVTDELNKKIEDAPSDGRKYARMNGEWVKDTDDLAIIEIDQTISDPATMIGGNVNGFVIQWIRKNSHRVLAKKTGDGTVTYIELDDNNSNKYAADGSEAKTDGTEGDVFVKLPTFYYKGTEGDKVKLYFSLSKIDDDYVEWDTNILIGAYEAYNDNSKLYSKSGVESSGSISQARSKSCAAARGSGYQLVDWQMHCVLGCLFYAMYGNTNSQAICGSGTDSNNKICGETNSLGMNDTKAETNGNTMSINFWGLENWWGDKAEWMEGIESTAADTVQILSPDPSSGRTFTWYNDPAYGKHYRFGKYLDLSSDVTSSGGNSTYYCDTNYGPTTSARVVSRSHFSALADGGVSRASVGSASSTLGGNFGSRLAFRGTCTRAESVEAFKSLPVL